MEMETPRHEDSREREIKDRLAGCIALEHSMSELYRMMAERFPSEAAFFMELADEEVTHAMTLEAGELLGRIGDGQRRLLPPAGSLVMNTLSAVERVKADMSISAISLAEALKTAVMLESTAVERFFIQVADESEGTPLQKYLISLLAEERGHIDRIRSRMMDLGIKKPS